MYKLMVGCVGQLHIVCAVDIIMAVCPNRSLPFRVVGVSATAFIFGKGFEHYVEGQAFRYALPVIVYQFGDDPCCGESFHDVGD